MSVDLKWTCVAGALVITVWSAEHGQLMTVTPASSVFRPVVVAELFTSEGCSSCPPADDVLSQLARQPASDVEVLALGEHVDYWDRLGWRDPFSSPAYSSRQSNYDTRVFHRNEVYTPQLVIDGRFESVGSDVDGIHHAITQAAAAPKALVEVTIVSAHDRQLGVTVHVGVPPALTLRESVDVLVAVAEDNLLSRVRRGENGGRTLRHSGVVRSLTSVGTLSPHDRVWSTSAAVVLEPEWQPANVRVVSVLQERESRRIVGAGSSRVGPAEPGFESNDMLSNVVPDPLSRTALMSEHALSRRDQ
jgi:hypothetical protein